MGDSFRVDVTHTPAIQGYTLRSYPRLLSGDAFSVILLSSTATGRNLLVKLVKFVVKKKNWETSVVLLEEVVEVEVIIGRLLLGGFSRFLSGQEVLVVVLGLRERLGNL